ncbi:MAG: chorismate pyruvate-lyase family protein [Candidatus Methylomirabilis sp.]|nr:chorismate pyruvate-lyase family protein [Deltaproteobacteria bacterium]
MAKGYSYSLLKEWLGAEEARNSPFIEGLLPHQKLLLFSEGSMTVELELLTRARVEAEVRLTGDTLLTPEEASCLQAAPGSKATEREVWLKAGGRKLIYARTLIPSNMIDPKLFEALYGSGKGAGQNYSEPLGRVLAENGILFGKERLDIGIVRSPSVSLELGAPAETPLFARRYVLFNGSAERWIIKAAVAEIFSPELAALSVRS